MAICHTWESHGRGSYKLRIKPVNAMIIGHMFVEPHRILISMQLQPPPPPTSSGSARVPLSAPCSNHCNLAMELHVVAASCSNLRWWWSWFLHFHPDLCTLCLWWLSPAVTYGGSVSSSAVGTNTPLAHVVVSPSATCAGGVFPSYHWRRYRTYTCGSVFWGDHWLPPIGLQSSWRKIQRLLPFNVLHVAWPGNTAN